MMTNILQKLLEAVELGKVDKNSPYPPHLKGLDGSSEFTIKALESGIPPQQILDTSLIPAMALVGNKFNDHKVFVPQMLMSARAMGASMVHLKPFFTSGEIKAKGTFITGTVKGDLHDIGKNLVSMMVEGSGWNIVDLGVDVGSQRFNKALRQNPRAVVGISALLTTTMANMEEIVASIKMEHPNTRILIGGAPINEEFCKKIGADFYGPNPQKAVEYLDSLVA